MPSDEKEIDLVDMMGDERGAQLPVKTGGAAPVQKAHSDPMSMTEFAQWVNNFGGGAGLRDALQQAAFMLCCDVISQDIAKSTLRLRERSGPKTSRIVMPNEHPMAALLALEPNRRHTWYNFVEMMTLWSCLTKNSLAVVLRNRFGDPIEIVPVQTGRVTELIEGRDVFYRVIATSGQELAMLGAYTLDVPERDMIHVRIRILDGMEGYSTLWTGKTTLNTSKAMEDYRNNLFSEEGQIRGVFSRDQSAGPMNEEAFLRLREQFRVLMSRFRQLTEPIILEGGMKFEPISSNPQEMEFSKQFSEQITQMCRLLRVPPHKVFQLDGSKYENLAEQEKMYVDQTLVPIAKSHEERYAKTLLSRDDRLRYFFEHDREEMTLRDSRAETERVIKATERGIYTIDEARAHFGKNELPNGTGNVRLIPVNMTVVDENNEAIVFGRAADEPPADDEPKTDQGVDKGVRLIVDNR